jgi:hypothetical protein
MPDTKPYIARCYAQLTDGTMGWQSLAVECDGTKEDAARQLVAKHDNIACITVEQLVRPYVVMEKIDV